MSDRLQRLTGGAAEPKPKGLAGWAAGRGRRREYWLIVGIVLAAMTALSAAGLNAAALVVSFEVTLAFIRRLHDLGWSGWLAPVIDVALNVASGLLGALVSGGLGAALGALLYLGTLVVLGALPGESRANEYGPPPGQRPRPDLAETFQ